MGRPRTIREIDGRGQDVRVWCFACARGGRIDAIIWQLFVERGWCDELDVAWARFRCKECDSAADVLLVPATRPRRNISNAPADLVAGFFHTMRSARKAEVREAKQRPPEG